MTWSTASSRNRRTTSRISRCCAPTACRRITMPRAWMTPTCGFRISCAGRTTLSNTFKHVLLFEGLQVEPPRFAHLPLSTARTGRSCPSASMVRWCRSPPIATPAFCRTPTSNSRACSAGIRRTTARRCRARSWWRRSRSRVSTAPMRWSISPRKTRSTRRRCGRNSQHIYALPVDELSRLPWSLVAAAGHLIEPATLCAYLCSIQERIKTLNDVLAVADFFFEKELKPYDAARLIDATKRRCRHGPARVAGGPHRRRKRVFASRPGMLLCAPKRPRSA